MLQSVIIQNVELIKRIFIGLLTGLVKSSNHTKRVLLCNQKYMIQPTLVNLHPNEYSQEFHYYSFDVKLDVLKVVILWMIYLMKHVFQIEDLSLTVFNNVNVNLDLLEEIEIQINAGIMINVNMSVKNVMYVGKIMFGIMLHVIVKMENI